MSEGWPGGSGGEEQSQARGRPEWGHDDIGLRSGPCLPGRIETGGTRFLGLLLATVLMAAAVVSRLIAVRTAFDVVDDEISYADISASLHHGAFPPRFDGYPFLLHPPLYFALCALWQALAHSGQSLAELVLQGREVNAVCAALSVGLIFYIGTRLVNWYVGAAASLLFIFDPFLQQINGRALLETSTWLFGLLGWAVLLPVFQERAAHPMGFAVVGGLALGMSMVDKDIAVVVALLPLLVAVVLRWADRRALGVATACSLVPSAAYLIALARVGALASWASQETSGLRRMLGLERVSGFGVQGHPSVIASLIRQLPLYGWSYLVCGLGILGAVYLVTRRGRPDAQVLGTITLAAVLTLVYGSLFGTSEPQMFYFPAIPALIALPVAGAGLMKAVPLPSSGVLRAMAAAALAVVLSFESAGWVQLRTSPDNGVQRLVAWFEGRLPPATICRCLVVADDTDSVQMALQQSGIQAVAAGTPAEARSQGVVYVTMSSVMTAERYGTLTGAEASWYKAHGTLVYHFTERTDGEVSVYMTKDLGLW